MRRRGGGFLLMECRSGGRKLLRTRPLLWKLAALLEKGSGEGNGRINGWRRYCGLEESTM